MNNIKAIKTQHSNYLCFVDQIIAIYIIKENFGSDKISYYLFAKTKCFLEELCLGVYSTQERAQQEINNIAFFLQNSAAVVYNTREDECEGD